MAFSTVLDSAALILLYCVTTLLVSQAFVCKYMRQFGVDVKNACFGGTQAVFHAFDWIYANCSTERRDAIAVLADIALYEPGPARPTGGAGANAVLITLNAPIAFDRGL